MLESVPVFGLLRSGYFLLTNLKRRLWPRTPVEVIPLLRDHVEYGHEIMLINTSDEPIFIYSMDAIDFPKAINVFALLAHSTASLNTEIKEPSVMRTITSSCP
jgi:hypothetical protein